MLERLSPALTPLQQISHDFRKDAWLWTLATFGVCVVSASVQAPALTPKLVALLSVPPGTTVALVATWVTARMAEVCAPAPLRRPLQACLRMVGPKRRNAMSVSSRAAGILLGYGAFLFVILQFAGTLAVVSASATAVGLYMLAWMLPRFRTAARVGTPLPSWASWPISVALLGCAVWILAIGGRQLLDALRLLLGASA